MPVSISKVSFEGDGLELLYTVYTVEACSPYRRPAICVGDSHVERSVFVEKDFELAGTAIMRGEKGCYLESLKYRMARV